MLNNVENVILCLVVNVSQEDCNKVSGKEPVELADEADEEKDEGESSMPIRKGRYKCDKCLKRFETYQALVAHRASQHKKKNKDQVEDSDNDNVDDDRDCKGDEEGEEVIRNVIITRVGGGERNVIKKGHHGNGGAQVTRKKKKRVFKCPFCPEVFRSGVALGGHKKVHSSALAVTEPTTVVEEEQEKTTSSRTIVIDLNFPPTIDDDEEEEEE